MFFRCMMFSVCFEHSIRPNEAANKKLCVNLGLHLRPGPQLGESIVYPYRGNPLYHSGFSVKIRHARAPIPSSCETWGTLEPNSYDRTLVWDLINIFFMFSDPDAHPTPKTYRFEKKSWYGPQVVATGSGRSTCTTKGITVDGAWFQARKMPDFLFAASLGRIDCSKHSENIINRKNIFFTSKLYPQKKSAAKKKTFFGRPKNIFVFFSSKNFRRKIEKLSMKN